MPSGNAPSGGRSWRLAALLVLGALLGGTPASGRSSTDVDIVTLDQALTNLASLVAEAVKGQNQSSVVVSGFNNPFDKEKAAGAGIRAKLIDALKTLGVQTTSKASLALEGNYVVSTPEVEGDGSKVPAAKITYILSTKNGKKVLDSATPVQGDNPKDRPAIVTDKASVATLMGANIEVKPNEPAKADEKFAKAIDSDTKAASTVEIDGTRVRPEKGSKFAVEILKAKLPSSKEAPPESSYQAANPTLRDGVPYVDIDSGEVYAVVIHNEQPFDVAAKVLIDGLSVYQFSAEKGKRSEFWIVTKAEGGGGTSGALFGWHRKANPEGLDDFDTFLIHEYSKASEAKSIADESSKGQICVEFHSAFEKGKEPADEKEAGKNTKGTTETIAGPPTKKKIKLLERQIGKFRAAVTVRYDRVYPDTP